MSENKIAIVFPGQGSQSLGMLGDTASQFSEVMHAFNQASDVLGYDLWNLVQNGPIEKLNQTEITQPALLAASFAVWQILQSKQAGMPAMLAGHSLGEYTALVCAGALSFGDAVKLVAARGKFMQEAVLNIDGAMAAIVGLDDAIVKDICQEVAEATGLVLSPANYNSLGQVVIAGYKEAVERAMQLAKEKGAKMAVIIPVSVPSHCDLMHPAADHLAHLLKEINISIPSVPVINNADVKPYESAETIRDGLTRQLYMPVRWVETIQYFTSHGISSVIECGPGKVLTGLNKRIDKTLTLFSTADIASLESVLP